MPKGLPTRGRKALRGLGCRTDYLLPPDFFVYWLIPSGLLPRGRLAEVLQAVPRLDGLLLAVPRFERLLRDDEAPLFTPDLLAEACERPDVLLFDSFIALKKL